MLDSAFGIFNNVSPRWQWAEVDLTFPTSDVYFDLANFNELLTMQKYPVPKMKIKDAFLILFSTPDSEGRNLQILRDGDLSPLDMQMMIHCTLFPTPHQPIKLTTHSPLHAHLALPLLQPATAPPDRLANPVFANAAALQDRHGELETDLGRHPRRRAPRRVGEDRLPEELGAVLRGCQGHRQCLGASRWEIPCSA